MCVRVLGTAVYTQPPLKIARRRGRLAGTPPSAEAIYSAADESLSPLGRAHLYGYLIFIHDRIVYVCVYAFV